MFGAMKSLSIYTRATAERVQRQRLARQGAGKTVATLKFVKDPSTVKLSAGTRTVTFAARSGALHCARILLTLDDGRTSSFLLDSPIPDKTSMSEALDQQNPKGTHASVDIECQAEGATGQLIVSAR
jgi:plastocyanin